MGLFDKNGKHRLIKSFRDGAMQEAAMVRGDVAALARMLHEAKPEKRKPAHT